LLSLLFVSAGISHFISPEPFLAIVPPYLPAALFLVYLSGAAEILGGLGIWIQPIRKWAGWGLVVLLVAVFPANVYGFQNGMKISGESVPEWILLLRLPLQAILFWWVYLTCCAPDRSKNA